MVVVNRIVWVRLNVVVISGVKWVGNDVNCVLRRSRIVVVVVVVAEGVVNDNKMNTILVIVVMIDGAKAKKNERMIPKRA